MASQVALPGTQIEDHLLTSPLGVRSIGERPGLFGTSAIWWEVHQDAHLSFADHIHEGAGLLAHLQRFIV